MTTSKLSFFIGFTDSTGVRYAYFIMFISCLQEANHSVLIVMRNLQWCLVGSTLQRSYQWLLGYEYCEQFAVKHVLIYRFNITLKVRNIQPTMTFRNPYHNTCVYRCVENAGLQIVRYSSWKVKGFIGSLQEKRHHEYFWTS